jgi:hypothetical protein
MICAPRYAIVAIAFSAVLIPASGQNRLKNDAIDLNACIPAHQFAELPESIAGTQTDAYGKTTVALGAYERVSPDGRFVLRSFSGGRLGEVSLIELSADGQVVRALATPLKNEAFPVQGSWRYLVDTNGDHYTFESILRSQYAGYMPNSSQNAAQPVQPVFRGGMDGFYAAASELPSAKPGHIRIRSLSWPNASGDSQTQGQGALATRTIEVDVQRQRITQDSGVVFHCKERVKQDGPLYALPMISVDGTEFAALPQTPVQGKQTLRIFGFGRDGKGCEAQQTFDFASGKAIFGFSSEGQAANIAWEYDTQAFWYSRELQTPFNIAPAELGGRATGQHFELHASAFPGLTRDGRVIYGATLKDCNASAASCRERVGYIISDPYQSNAYRNFMLTYKGPARQQCITVGDVLREREAFRALFSLP